MEMGKKDARIGKRVFEEFTRVYGDKCNDGRWSLVIVRKPIGVHDHRCVIASLAFQNGLCPCSAPIV